MIVGDDVIGNCLSGSVRHYYVGFSCGKGIGLDPANERADGNGRGLGEGISGYIVGYDCGNCGSTCSDTCDGCTAAVTGNGCDACISNGPSYGVVGCVVGCSGHRDA